ncbi:putative calcium-transporting ATPase 13, plasma membrane-type [Lycium ferocissimum]|uniref:putative calcium-transporting ATPase 13, plasma membrane-type n=1 Tax=Lycium ferocissimum TaxID=112874 RepID=UPI0028151A93|nr:putative calcium-transporting ATPase 13, plasma membrane-type [Lycium ferocissimum]
MMEDHEDNGSTIDLEAQGSSPLLMNDELATFYGLMRRSVLLLRCTHRFIEAGARSLSRVSSSSSSSTTIFYTPLSSFDIQPGGDHEIQIDEIVAASPDGDWRVSTVQSNNDHIEIELQPHESHQQCLQITKINEIVKEKNLDSLDNFGGVTGVAEALSSDVDKGIHVGDISRRRKATNLSNHMIFRQLVCKEPTILLLLVAAILSFGFGINEEGVQNGWFEGAILVVIILVTVSFKLARNWYKRRCWKKQKDHKANAIQVIRGGNEVPILASDLVYGDIAYVRKGHSVPAHGLFVSGEKVELFHLDDGLVSIANEQSPFLSPGSKVINGDVRMIVTSVQMDKASQKSKISETDSSFCAYFDKLNNYIHISGLLIGILIIVVVFIRFKLGDKDDENGYRLETKEEPAEIARIMNAVKKVLTESKGTVRVWITLSGVTLLGMTEGIPFLISIAMAYWHSNFDVNMESVSTLCIESASWLKEQRMEVTQFFLDKKDVTKIPPHVCSVLSDGIGIGVSTQTAYHRIEEPILCWAEKNMGMERDTLNQQFTIVKDNDNEMNPFEEPCGVVIQKNGDNGKEYYSHFKGPADSILAMCSNYYDLKGEVQDLDDKTKSDFAQANKNVNVVAFACKRTQLAELDKNGLTFIGMFVLKDAFNLDNMRQAIAILKEGGVKIIFASEEDVEVLRTIGNDMGLLSSHDALVVRGEDFYNFTVDDIKEKVEKICIMGNSSPAHKLLLVEWLKKIGEVMAVVGEQAAAESNLVLEAAHFGLPVVTNWPETITHAINSIKGGRIVCENLRQFIQLEVILAITSLSINFILVMLDGDAPLTTIQLIWVYLLVTFIGGPTLLIQQSTRKLRDELSIRPRKPPITKAMWRNILFQASYQTSIFVFLQHRGSAILGISPKVNKSTVFNGFALCQLFNIFSARKSEQKNFFKGLGQNYWFWAVSGLYLVLQLGFIEVEPVFVFSNTARLNWKQWAECIFIGAVTWLLDWIVKWASEYIKIDKLDCGVFHLARINCCYGGPRSTPNSTLPSLDSPLVERAG